MVPTDTPASKFDEPTSQHKPREVGGTVNGVTDDGVACAFALHDDYIFFFFGDNDADFAAIFHCVNEDLVS